MHLLTYICSWTFPIRWWNLSLLRIRSITRHIPIHFDCLTIIASAVRSIWFLKWSSLSCFTLFTIFDSMATFISFCCFSEVILLLYVELIVVLRGRRLWNGWGICYQSARRLQMSSLLNKGCWKNWLLLMAEIFFIRVLMLMGWASWVVCIRFKGVGWISFCVWDNFLMLYLKSTVIIGFGNLTFLLTRIGS